MRRIDLDRPTRFSIDPRITDTTARENEGVRRAIGINEREPHIAVGRNVGMGIDLVPHAKCRACDAETRLDLAQFGGNVGRGAGTMQRSHGPLHSTRKYQALSGASKDGEG